MSSCPSWTSTNAKFKAKRLLYVATSRFLFAKSDTLEVVSWKSNHLVISLSNRKKALTQDSLYKEPRCESLIKRGDCITQK